MYYSPLHQLGLFIAIAISFLPLAYIFIILNTFVVCIGLYILWPGMDLAELFATRSTTLKRMHDDGIWSDLTIRTATKTFKVHKSVVCPACPFSHAACTNGFKESRTGMIELPESERVVEVILQHIYEQRIPWLERKYRDSLSQEELRALIDLTLELDLAVDKYNLPSLAELLEPSFLSNYVQIKDLTESVLIARDVYRSDRPINEIFRKDVRTALAYQMEYIVKDRTRGNPFTEEKSF